MAVKSLARIKRQEKVIHGRHWLMRLMIALSFAGVLVLAYFAANLIIGSVLNLLASMGVGFTLKESVLAAVLTASVFLSMLGLLLIFEYVITRNKKPLAILKTIRFNRLLTFKDIGFGVLGFVPALILAGIFTALVMTVFPHIDATEQQQTGFNNIILRYEYVIAFIMLVVVVPVVEEIIFRGYLFTKIREQVGFVATMLIVSLVFAALHAPILAAVGAFGLSLVMCFLREYTNSIWAGIILHSTRNGVSFFFLFIAPYLLQ